MDLSYVFYPLVAYLFAIAAHELGHVAYFNKLGKNPKIRFNKRSFEVGTEDDYVGLTDKQYKELMFAGIAAGFIPIFVIAMAAPDGVNLFVLAMAIPYMFGAGSDIQQVVVVH